MNFTIVTIGSHGDIVPFLALARGLAQHGHSVRIAALSRFKAYVERNGFQYMPLTGDADEVIRLLIGVDVTPVGYFSGLDFMMKRYRVQIMEDVFRACEGADGVVYSVLGSLAWHAAQKLGIPAFRAFPCPLDPTPDFPTMTAPDLPLGGLYNRFTYKAGDVLWGLMTTRHVSAWRESVHLPRLAPLAFPYRQLDGKPVQTLYPFSPTLVPRPTGWGQELHITGYWFLNEGQDWQAPETLTRFLDAGTAPLYIGFGSMLGGSFRSALDMILAALQRTHLRAVLSSGWGNLTQADLPDCVCKIDYVPHDWLFPRVRGVVHHGGAGTTAAGLKAGRPSLIIPFGGDQPFWAKRVYAAGAGPQPIHRRRLSVEGLCTAFDALANDPSLKIKAQAIGAAIQQEDGVGEAVQIIERTV